MKFKVDNITSDNGNIIANQFIIKFTDDNGNNVEVFQSYKTVIAQKVNGILTLDTSALEYSRTTLKYLKIFLNTSKSKADLYKWIESENINVADLN